MKIRNKIRISILLTIILLYLIIILFPRGKNKKIDDTGFYDVYKIYDYILVASIQGSGEYVYLQLFTEEIFNKNKLSFKDHYPSNEYMDKYNLFLKLSKPVLYSYPEGNYLIGDYDFDGEIEITTFPNEFWKGFKNFQPVQVNRQGAVTVENNKMTLLILKVFSFFSSIFTVMIFFFLMTLIIFSYILEYFIKYIFWIYRNRIRRFPGI